MTDRPARVSDVHQIAAAMPHTRRIEGPKGNAVYQVGGKSFVFFRTPQPDAVDPETGNAIATSLCCGWNPRATSWHWCRTRRLRFSPLTGSMATRRFWCGPAD
ncbi:hypothetical protein I553_10348 [Mycobacterium xenopi 4042]|uniref:Uncharacterized protein n=1 Tax=Mycobacterium xenopi 4042 TaxID=1299334 RepID=X7ZKS8_MYCXE|nr:hypothetical protein I553_10348 [Mycobacterium xenopi 4042]